MEKAVSLEYNKRLIVAHKYCQQELSPLPFCVRKPTCLKSNRYIKTGHWTQKEKMRLCIFMDYHKEFFGNRQNRRVFKIFKCMAEFMKTRNANQCRSHHQKMEQQYSDPQLFISSTMKQRGREQYEKHYNMYVKELQSLDREMGMDKLQEQEQIIAQLPLKNQEQVEFKKPEEFQKQALNLIKKKNQEIPTMNTYQTYNKYQNLLSNSGLNNFNEPNLSGNKNDSSNNFKSMFKTSLNTMPINTQNEKMDSMLMNYPMSNCYPYQTQPNFNLEQANRLKQKEKTLQDCNFYWKNYMKSLLKLQSLTEQRDMNIGSQSLSQNLLNNIHFLLRPQ